MRKLVIALCLLILVSCTGESTDKAGSWRTGSQGIVLSYVADNPPAEVISTSKINVMVKYANKGAFATNPAFYLTGYDSLILPFSEPAKTVGVISGKDQYNPEGSQEGIVQWSSPITMTSLQDVDSFKQAVSVTSCYDYETYATPNICIDPQKYDYLGATKCDYDVKDLGESQGAPIAVSQVKQKATDEEIFLEIHFTNKGAGTPYIGGDCMRLGFDEIDKIRLAEVNMGGLAFNCMPEEVRLASGKGFAVCSRPLENKYAYNSVLSIRLRYSYRDTLPKKEITIVNIKRK